MAVGLSDSDLQRVLLEMVLSGQLPGGRSAAVSFLPPVLPKMDKYGNPYPMDQSWQSARANLNENVNQALGDVLFGLLSGGIDWMQGLPSEPKPVEPDPELVAYSTSTDPIIKVAFEGMSIGLPREQVKASIYEKVMGEAGGDLDDESRARLEQRLRLYESAVDNMFDANSRFLAAQREAAAAVEDSPVREELRRAGLPMPDEMNDPQQFVDAAALDELARRAMELDYAERTRRSRQAGEVVPRQQAERKPQVKQQGGWQVGGFAAQLEEIARRVAEKARGGGLGFFGANPQPAPVRAAGPVVTMADLGRYVASGPMSAAGMAESSRIDNAANRVWREAEQRAMAEFERGNTPLQRALVARLLAMGIG